MGSRQHSAGVGFSPRLIGQRTLSSLFEAESQRRADLRPVRYHAHVGGTVHLVKDLCSEQIFRVSGPPNLSFARGAVVPAGSFNGLQGEFLTGFPAMGQAGGSELPVSLSVRSTGLRVKGPCPTVPLGKTYLGIYIDFAASPDKLYAFRYTDGTYESIAGSVDLVGVSLFLTSGNPIQRIHTQGDVIIFRGQKSGDRCLVTWNIAAGTLKVAEPHLDDMGGPIWPGSGSFMYFVEAAFFDGSQHLQLYRCPIGFEGAIDLEAAKVGAEYIEPSGDLTCPAVLYASTTDFQIPSFYSDADGAAIPYFKAGGWNLGADRSYLTPGSNVNGYGYPGPGESIVRANNYEDFNETISVLPGAPGAAERDLFPPEWNLSLVGQLSMSPQRNEVTAYAIAGDDIPDAALLRVPIESTAFNAACPVPYIVVEPATPTGEVPSVMLARD